MSIAPFIATQRFGIGSNAKDSQRVAANPKSWLKSQLTAKDGALLKGDFQSSDALVRSIGNPREVNAEERQKRVRSGFEMYRAEMDTRFQHAVSTEMPLLERLALFWSNHFTVSVKGKPIIARLVGAFEREAIRPHVLGKFSDMLLAVVQHPAMLMYLDNIQSIGPNSRAGKARDRGLNENLSREILELHTLGVGGGYDQDDVIGLAKILTGWTIVPPRMGGGGYRFLNPIHEPGSHRLLGKTYRQSGETQGIAALKDLANHPSTARFIATKMVRHFVSDTPPESSIRALEHTFLQTGGDLKAMVETLIDMNDVWAEPHQKIKTPYEMIVSTFRLLNVPANKMDYRRIHQSLSLMEHIPFQATSPAGWGDTADDWLSPNATMVRVEWCHAIAQTLRPRENPLTLAQAALGDAANADTLLWIERAPTPVDGLALLLASPEWQSR